MAAVRKGTGRRTGNKNSRRGKSGAGGKVPGWLWLAAGIAIGILVAMLTRLAPNIGVTPPPGEHATVEEHQDQAPDSSTGPVFDFYTLLPESEVMVPSSTGQDRPPAASRAAKSEEKRPQPDTTGTRSFLLQAGSFRNEKDADRLRARLILNGFDAHIQPVSVRGGEKWHRVQLGPYNSESGVQKVRGQLSALGLDTMLLRQR